MKSEGTIIAYRGIRRIATGELVTPLAPVFAEDWPSHNVHPDQSLLRYMDFWKFEDLLKSRELHFTRADKFDDPLEGTLSPKDVHGTSKSDVAFAAALNSEKRDYERSSEYRSTAKRCTFINCWHINTREDPKMWNAYTKSPDSLVVITTAARLAASVKLPVFGAGVKYVSEDTPRTEFDERSLFYYKDVQYAFEREFRLLVDLLVLGGSVQHDNPADFHRRIPIDVCTLIEGLQPHPLASEGTKNRIRHLLSTHLPSATETHTP